MTPPGNLEAFTLAALDLLGGAAEERAAGLYTALWPAAGDGQLETRHLAFDPELIDERPDAELVTFGSPALEDLIGRATASGRVAQAFLPAPVNPSRTVLDQLARAYRFRDGAWIAESGHPWWLPAGIFLFRVRYLSDAREEDLVQVAVNLADGRILRRLDESITRHGIAADPRGAWPMLPELSAAKAYALARAELEQKLVSPLGARRRELAARLARESGRAAAYYDELIREYQELRAGLAAGESEHARTDARLAALRLEREGRLGELRSKYRLEAEVSLRSLLRLYLPRVVFSGKLAGKRGDGASLSLAWDPVEHAGEPVRCAQCDGLAYEVGLRHAQVTCARCLDALTRPRGGV